MRVAFFTHRFLEPTHHAIAQIVSALASCRFTVFAKDFSDQQYFDLPNVVERHFYTKGPLPQLKPSGFDLAHAVFDGKTALRAAIAAKQTGIPFILSFHGGFDTQSKIFDQRHTEWVKKTIRESASVTVVCKSDEVRIRSIGVTKPIEIVPVPIDLSLIPDRKERNKNKILAVGRLIPKKGIDIAIKSLSLLPENYTLSVVGDGACSNDLRELVESLQVKHRVEWLVLQPLDITLSIMQEAGALIHPARVAQDGNAEGNPQVILWAQAMGLPVITTLTGSLMDIVEHTHSGWLIPPESPEALAEAVLNISENLVLREQITKGGIESVRKHHLLPNIVDQVYKLYQRAACGYTTTGGNSASG